MKRELPSTSKAAYQQAKEGLLEGHHAKIISALQELGIANYEVIAAKAGLERHAVGRRLKELEGEQRVFKPGSKSLTKTNRLAYDYCLTSSETVKTEKEVKYVPREKTAAEYSAELIKSCQQAQLNFDV